MSISTNYSSKQSLVSSSVKIKAKKKPGLFRQSGQAMTEYIINY